MARYPQGLLVSCQIPWDEKDRLLDSAKTRIKRRGGFCMSDFPSSLICGDAD